MQITPSENAIPVIPFPLTDGRSIPSPEVTQIMAEMLDLQASDKLLEIGTGSGTQTSLWAKYGCEIHSIECKPMIDPEEYGRKQVYLHIGDGKKGLKEHAPYSKIVATCGVSEIPEPWIHQLAANGRMVVPQGDPECQRLTLFAKDENGVFAAQQIRAYVRFLMIR